MNSDIKFKAGFPLCKGFLCVCLCAVELRFKAIQHRGFADYPRGSKPPSHGIHFSSFQNGKNTLTVPTQLSILEQW